MTATPTTPTGAGWMKAFEQAGGRRADAQWAGRVVMKMKGAGCQAADVDAFLTAVLDEVGATGEPAAGLRGSADEAAAQQIEALSMSGARFTEVGLTGRDAVLVGLLFCVVLAAVLGTGDLLTHHPRDFSVDALAMIGGIGGGIAVMGDVWGRVARRHGPGAAIGAGLLAGAPVMVLGALASSRSHAPALPSWWWFVLAAGLAVAAWLVHRLLPAARPRPVVVVDDDDWLEQARAELLRRDDVPPAEVERRLEEAIAHAHDAGSTLTEEFGNPRGFARSLPGNVRVGFRRTAWWMTAVAVADGLLFLHGPVEGWQLFATGLVVLSAILFWVMSFVAPTTGARR